MFDHDIHQSKYNELRSIYKYYIDSYKALYQLKTEKEEELNSIYKMIKSELIDSKKFLPQDVINDNLNMIPFNNRYTKSYLSLAKLLSDEYHVKAVNNIPLISNYLFYEEYGIKLVKSADFNKFKSKDIHIFTEDTIYRAIMYDDIKRFIPFTQSDEFYQCYQYQHFLIEFYPKYYIGYSLLVLCCYHGAVDCFKFLRTKFNSQITRECLQFSFLGGNPEIISECLKYEKPDKFCMEYAIASHNIDFVTFLMNEYNLEIDLKCCGEYNNLESFLVYFDQTNDINNCFIYSAIFDIPSLCEYLLSHGANVNEKDKDGKTALYYAAECNKKATTQLLLLNGANIHEKDYEGKTILHRVAWNNRIESAEVLISYGANVNEKDRFGNLALHFAASNNFEEMTELLISHCANINEKEYHGKTALHETASWNSKETAEVLISHGANVNEKNNDGCTALHIATEHNYKQIIEFLISHSANINEKDNYGCTTLHIATESEEEEIVELLISYGAKQ
ncbi:ankyrin repeat protein, putative [Trichomonas vaginalis G3]|uniref:Ankyrin repeat protein, putative n=1 Tax=Trichomonas vaginalis (strain ATCC PRA-98 / G3) TaxID=412133 RepID=A2F718_TRIV3|nr:ankyrin repeat protein, putative [Trichomonas vaginalis G3]|eukprot:XP_001312253.1 ankyrin repeat protein [Trichomonas vaginalis G3]